MRKYLNLILFLSCSLAFASSQNQDKARTYWMNVYFKNIESLSKLRRPYVAKAAQVILELRQGRRDYLDMIAMDFFNGVKSYRDPKFTKIQRLMADLLLLDFTDEQEFFFRGNKVLNKAMQAYLKSYKQKGYDFKFSVESVLALDEYRKSVLSVRFCTKNFYNVEWKMIYSLYETDYDALQFAFSNWMNPVTEMPEPDYYCRSFAIRNKAQITEWPASTRFGESYSGHEIDYRLRELAFGTQITLNDFLKLHGVY